MLVKVYRALIKTKKDFETEKEFEEYVKEYNSKLNKFGFMHLPKKLCVARENAFVSEDIVLFRLEKQEKDSPLVESLFSKYEDARWQRENIYGEDGKPNYEIIDKFKEIGIQFELGYDEKIKAPKFFVKRTEEVYDMFEMWRLEFNFSTDRILGLTIGDTSVEEYINADVLEKYCKKTIKKLLKAKLIEKIEIDFNVEEE